MTLLAFEGVSLGLYGGPNNSNSRAPSTSFIPQEPQLGLGSIGPFLPLRLPTPLVKDLESIWPVAGSILMGHLETGDVTDGPVDHPELYWSELGQIHL